MYEKKLEIFPGALMIASTGELSFVIDNSTRTLTNHRLYMNLTLPMNISSFRIYEGVFSLNNIHRNSNYEFKQFYLEVKGPLY